jgi:hypothetical protein
MELAKIQQPQQRFMMKTTYPRFWLLVMASLFCLGAANSLHAQDGKANEEPAAQEVGAPFLPWRTIQVPNDRLPWGIYEPATMSLDGKNLTPGFEAMASRFGKVALRFEEREEKIILALNKRPIRYQPNDWVELGNRGHFAYVRAADDRLMFRIGLFIDWLRGNKQKAETAIGKQALAEFEDLYNKNEKAKLANGRKNELAELDLDYFLFQYLEGRPALMPIPGTKTTLCTFWERELWAHQNGKGRFNHNSQKDLKFIEFHCQKFTGVDGSPFKGKHRNPPPSQLGDPEIQDK